MLVWSIIRPFEGLRLMISDGQDRIVIAVVGFGGATRWPVRHDGPMTSSRSKGFIIIRWVFVLDLVLVAISALCLPYRFQEWNDSIIGSSSNSSGSSTMVVNSLCFPIVDRGGGGGRN